MAFILCELYRDYDFRTFYRTIFLWAKEAGIYCVDGSCDAGGDVDDVTNYFILFWASVIDFSGGEYFNFTNFAVCNGVYVSCWDIYRNAGSVGGGGIFDGKIARFSHFGGGVAWLNGTVFDKD